MLPRVGHVESVVSRARLARLLSLQLAVAAARCCQFPCPVWLPSYLPQAPGVLLCTPLLQTPVGHFATFYTFHDAIGKNVEMCENFWTCLLL